MKTNKNRKLKGSVLFTVVSVMSLLIIFLTGTLVLAASANKRAHRTYSTSQAEYTARATIESFTAAMEHNPDIAGAIQNLNGTIYPTVELGTTGMGHIGCYITDDSGNSVYTEDKIKIEKLDDKYSQYYYTQAGSWEKLDTIKITATATVGKEEKSVTAYIRKKAPNEVKPNPIKGLQTAGGNNVDATEGTYTGALVLGVTETPGDFKINNGTNTHTDFNFINGNLDISGSGLNIYIDKNVDDNGNAVGTVIMGDLGIQNTSLVRLNYNMSADFTQNQVPYLYVDGQIRPLIHATLNLVSSVDNSRTNDSPFNVFAGSVDFRNAPVSIKGDLYLMDNNKTSYITKQSGAKLYTWLDSTYNKTASQFKSSGGSVYSKGSLNLAYVNVQGDVRVEGDLDLGPDTVIDGSVVVGGNLTMAANAVIKGDIYTNSTVDGVTPTLKPGVTMETDIDPKYVKVNNIEATYEVWTSTTPAPYYGWLDKNGNQVNTSNAEMYVDCFGNGYPKEPWNQAQYEGVTYYAEVDIDGITIIGTAPTDVDCYYYDPSDTSVHYKEDEVATYIYKDANGNVITEDQAFTGVKPLSAWPGSIYPTSMTREAVCGIGEANKSYKIVKTIDELRESLSVKVDDATGLPKFDNTIYYNDIPEATKKNAAYAKTYPSGTTSITSTGVLEGTYNNATINITPDSNGMWVVLKNFKAQATEIIVDDSAYSVNFLIDGAMNLDNCSIHSKNVINNSTITEQTAIGITFYGKEGSSINMINNNTICGTAKCPYTSISAAVQGRFNINYQTSSGSSINMLPVWIGNALFKEVKSSNNFQLAYCLAGGAGGGGELKTAAGAYIFNYYDQY